MTSSSLIYYFSLSFRSLSLRYLQSLHLFLSGRRRAVDQRAASVAGLGARVGPRCQGCARPSGRGRRHARLPRRRRPRHGLRARDAARLGARVGPRRRPSSRPRFQGHRGCGGCALVAGTRYATKAIFTALLVALVQAGITHVPAAQRIDSEGAAVPIQAAYVVETPRRILGLLCTTFMCVAVVPWLWVQLCML